MTLPTYHTGTVSVSSGGTVVTGVGSIWSGTAAKEGDFISINNLPSVQIIEVTDTTHLKIRPWAGSNQSGVSYVIDQNYSGRVVGVAAAEDVGAMLAALNSLGPIFNVPTGATEPDPSYGADGQYAHQITTDIWWLKTGGVWVVSASPSGAASLSASQTFAGVQTFSNTTDATGVGTTYGARFAGGVEIAKKLFVSGAVDIQPPSATSGTTFVPRVFGVIDGNITGGQVTTQRTPTAVFSRNENITDNGTSDGSDGPALYSVVTTSGTQQAVASSSLAYAYPASACDVVGVYGAASQNGTSGTHTGFGGFFYGQANTAGSGAIGTQNQIQNNTGVDKPYNPATLLSGLPFMVGADIAYSSTPAKLGQAGVLIRAGTGKWDVGIALINGVNSADIRTDTTSATILLAGPTAHVHGIDLTSATFSGAAFRSPNFNVDGTTGNITSAGGAYTQTTPAVTATAGTFTTASSFVREKKVGKIVHTHVTVTVTTLGSASGSMLVTLPTSALNPIAGGFGDLSNAAVVGSAILTGSTAILTPNGGMATGHNYLATFIYEGV